MSCDDDLARYHFDEMAPAERRVFEARLAAEPELARELERFRRCAADVDAEDAIPRASAAAPADLADRTCKLLGALGVDQSPAKPCGKRRIGALDLCFGVGSALLLAAIIFPAIQMSREESRRAQCADNLRTIGHALFAYSERHGGYFPVIEPGEHAGMYAVSLADSEAIARDELQRRLLCPSSSLAQCVADGRAAVVVPTLEQVRLSHALLLERLRRVSGGSYAYRWGYLNEGAYVPVTNRSDGRAALLGDAPDDVFSTSRNHGGCVQNVLFQDGSVRAVSGCWAQSGEDHLFLNAMGRLDAGRTSRDTVLAPSWATLGPVDAFPPIEACR